MDFSLKYSIEDMFSFTFLLFIENNIILNNHFIHFFSPQNVLVFENTTFEANGRRLFKSTKTTYNTLLNYLKSNLISIHL